MIDWLSSNGIEVIQERGTADELYRFTKSIETYLSSKLPGMLLAALGGFRQYLRTKWMGLREDIQ